MNIASAFPLPDARLSIPISVSGALTCPRPTPSSFHLSPLPSSQIFLPPRKITNDHAYRRDRRNGGETIYLVICLFVLSSQNHYRYLLAMKEARSLAHLLSLLSSLLTPAPSESPVRLCTFRHIRVVSRLGCRGYIQQRGGGGGGEQSVTWWSGPIYSMFQVVSEPHDIAL